MLEHSGANPVQLYMGGGGGDNWSNVAKVYKGCKVNTEDDRYLPRS